MCIRSRTRGSTSRQHYFRPWITAERLLTYETFTAEVLHSDEAEELTFEEFTLRSRTPTRLRGFITEELLTDETVPLRSCSLTKDVTAEESHTDEAE